MLSLGDERIAEPGPSLVYHLFRFVPDAPVTASRAAVMFSALMVRARGAPGPTRCLRPLRRAAFVALLELQAPAGPHEGRSVLEHVLLAMAPPYALPTEAPCDAPH